MPGSADEDHRHARLLARPKRGHGSAKALTVAPNTTLGLRASVDRAALTTFVSRVADRFDKKPTDSRLLFRNSKPVVTPSIEGLRVKRLATIAAVSDEVVHGTRAPITVPATTLKPAVTEDSFGPVVVIRRGANLLTLYSGQKRVRQFAVATGQTIYPTPLGRFQIGEVEEPWYPLPPWAGEKPRYLAREPAGTRWMGLSAPELAFTAHPRTA